MSMACVLGSNLEGSIPCHGRLSFGDWSCQKCLACHQKCSPLLESIIPLLDGERRGWKWTVYGFFAGHEQERTRMEHRRLLRPFSADTRNSVVCSFDKWDIGGENIDALGLQWADSHTGPPDNLYWCCPNMTTCCQHSEVGLFTGLRLPAEMNWTPELMSPR